MVFAQVTKAQKPQSTAVKIGAWLYAGTLTVMVMAQLFEFEKLVPLFHDMAFPGGDGTGSLLICLIVFAEVFAIPFLLRMPLSILMRQCSVVLGILVPLAWLGVAFWVLHVYPTATMNGGILGTKVSVTPGLQIAFALVLLIAALWLSQGLQPRRKK